MTNRPIDSCDLPRKIYFYIALFLIVSCFTGSVLSQDFMRLISQEDHLLENLTTGLLLGSAFFGIANWRKNQSNKNALAFFTSLAIVGFLDEISFGQRIINFTPPMAGGTSLDGFHDLANMSKKIIAINFQYHPGQTFLILTATILSLTAISYTFRRRVLALVNYFKRLKLNYVIASSTFAILFSQLLDLKLIPFSSATALEETLELIASLGLLTCLISITRSR